MSDEETDNLLEECLLLPEDLTSSSTTSKDSTALDALGAVEAKNNPEPEPSDKEAGHGSDWGYESETINAGTMEWVSTPTVKKQSSKSVLTVNGEEIKFYFDSPKPNWLRRLCTRGLLGWRWGDVQHDVGGAGLPNVEQWAGSLDIGITRTTKP